MIENCPCAKNTVDLALKIKAVDRSDYCNQYFSTWQESFLLERNIVLRDKQAAGVLFYSGR